MTGRTPRPRPALYRMATDRPLARRSLAAAAAVVCATPLAGCVRRRETAAGQIDKVTAQDEEGLLWVAHFRVGQDYDSHELLVQEELDRVQLDLALTTRTGASDNATGISKSHEFRLASPRGRRRFVDRDGQEISIG